MNFLITGGATREPIDGVRFITNMSSGETAATLSDYLIKEGHQVIYLAGTGSQKPIQPCPVVNYTTCDDLDKKLQKILSDKEIHVIVHAAAVGDYSVKTIRQNQNISSPNDSEKIESSQEMELVLKKNIKIIDHLKNYAKKSKPILVGFKLTQSNDETKRLSAIESLKLRSQADFIVHNDLHEIKQTGTHGFKIYKNLEVVAESPSKKELGATLLHALKRSGA